MNTSSVDRNQAAYSHPEESLLGPSSGLSLLGGLYIDVVRLFIYKGTGNDCAPLRKDGSGTKHTHDREFAVNALAAGLRVGYR